MTIVPMVTDRQWQDDTGMNRNMLAYRSPRVPCLCTLNAPTTVQLQGYRISKTWHAAFATHNPGTHRWITDTKTPHPCDVSRQLCGRLCVCAWTHCFCNHCKGSQHAEYISPCSTCLDHEGVNILTMSYMLAIAFNLPGRLMGPHRAKSSKTS